MKIVIHGTQGGYRSINPKNDIGWLELELGLSDARPDSKKVATIGQQAYSINFNKGNIIFSKYKIIRDVVADKKTGLITFSVIIPNNKKLSGEHVIKLLDQLTSTFCQKHIEYENLDNFREDWTFVSALANQYNSRLSPVPADDVENIPQGTADAAYIYYSNEEEMQKYFDAPYQPEYGSYRQIFFIEKSLETEAKNPLNALRHNTDANLTGLIDLTKKVYKLRDFYGKGQNGVSIELRTNGKQCSNNSKITNRDNITITYYKSYHHPKQESGKLNDYNIREYLMIDEESKKIEVRKDVPLKPETRTVTLHIQHKGSPVTTAEIIYKNAYQPEQRTRNNTITFKGEDIAKEWMFMAQTDKLISYSWKTIIPQDENILNLDLEEYKIIPIRVEDKKTGNSIPDFKIHIETLIFVSPPAIEFYHITKPRNIFISHKEYDSHTIHDFIPANETEISAQLEPKQYVNSPIGIKKEKKYELRIDEKQGKRRFKGDAIREYVTEFPPFGVTPRFGYKFGGWSDRQDEKYNGYDGYYEAIFQELWWHKNPKYVWVVGCIAICLLGAILIAVKYCNTDNNKQNDKTEIETLISYVNGIELKEDILTSYKDRYCAAENVQSVTNESKNKFPMKQINDLISLFTTKDKDSTKTPITDLPDYCAKINNALAIRKAINLGKIDDLKEKDYTTEQESFKQAIDGIDEHKDKISETMCAYSEDSEWDLNEVAKFITNLQKLLQIREEVKTLTMKDDLESKRTEVDAIIFPVDSIKSNIKAEIDIKLQPQQPKPQVTSEQQNQSQRGNAQQPSEDEFWKLVWTSGRPVKESYDNLFSNFDSNSPFKDFYNTYLQYSADFKKFQNILDEDRRKAKELTDLIDLINKQ